MLEQEIKDVKSDKLALLSEMLGIKDAYKHKWMRGVNFLNPYKCLKCGMEDKTLETNIDPCPYPDPITTDLRILAWQVRDKMVEMNKLDYWADTVQAAVVDFYKLTPASWIEAGITVYEESKGNKKC